MRPPSLRSQLNQIRLWVRQGRTDAWIAHKLDISVEQLEQFKREHLSKPEPPPPEVAAPPASEEAKAPPDEAPADETPEDEDTDERTDEELEPAEPGPARAEAPDRARRRRRGRRGGRRRSGARPATSYEGTFDHGAEGYGLWLDPAVAESQVYADNWVGHRAVTVTVEADAITIRRPGQERAEEREEEPEEEA